MFSRNAQHEVSRRKTRLDVMQNSKAQTLHPAGEIQHENFMWFEVCLLDEIFSFKQEKIYSFHIIEDTCRDQKFQEKFASVLMRIIEMFDESFIVQVIVHFIWNRTLN